MSGHGAAVHTTPQQSLPVAAGKQFVKWFARVASAPEDRIDPLTRTLDKIPIAAAVALLARAMYKGSNATRGLIAAAALASGYTAQAVRSTPAFQKKARAAELIREQDLLPLNALDILDNTHRLNDWIVETSLKAGSGKTFSLGPTLVVTSPENVQHILGDNFSNYIKGLEFTTMFKDVLGDGIFNTNGELWKQQRKTGVRIFTKRNFQGFMNEVFRDRGADLVDLLNNQYANKEKTVDIQDLYYKFTLDSIGKIGFGVELGLLKSHPAQNEFAEAFDGAQQKMLERMVSPICMSSPEFWDKYLKYLDFTEIAQRKRLKVMQKFGLDVIAERRADLRAEAELEAKQAEAVGSAKGNKGKKKGRGKKGKKARADLLSFFLRQQEKEQADQNLSAAEKKASEQYLIDIVLNFIIAGRDTTASTLSWATHEMLAHPDETRKLVEEIDAVLPNEAEMSYDDFLQRLPRLRIFLNETLRLHPPVPKDAKTAVEDDYLPDGTFVPAGAMVTYVPYAMGRDTAIWGEDAAEFKPSRWETHGSGGEAAEKAAVSTAAMALAVNPLAAAKSGPSGASCPFDANGAAGEDAAADGLTDTDGACPFARPKVDKHGLTEMLQPNSYHVPVFQGGPRTCIGREMAYFEASLCIVKLLQRFSLRRDPSMGEHPIPGESLVMPISGGLPVYVTSRQDKRGTAGARSRL